MVVDPRHATADGTKVARVQVPYFPDEIEYETLLEGSFQGPEFEEWRNSHAVLILATNEGYEKLEKLMGFEFADVPESAVIEEMRKLCLERQAVVLKWLPGGTA